MGRKNLKVSEETHALLRKQKRENESWDGFLERATSYEREYAPLSLQLSKQGVGLSEVRRSLEVTEKGLESVGVFFDDIIEILETLEEEQPAGVADIETKVHLKGDIDGELHNLMRMLKQEEVVEEVETPRIKYRLKETEDV